MSYNLDPQKKVLAVSLLSEGSSIRSVERVTGVHRDTVMRLAKFSETPPPRRPCRLLLSASPRGGREGKTRKENDDMKLYELTDEQLSDGPLARRAVDAGYPSLRSAADDCGWWSLDVEKVEEILSEPISQ